METDLLRNMDAMCDAPGHQARICGEAAAEIRRLIALAAAEYDRGFNAGYLQRRDDED